MPELLELLLVSVPDGAWVVPLLVVAPGPLLVVPVAPLAVVEDAVPEPVVPLAVPVLPAAVPDPVPDVGVAVEGALGTVGLSTAEEGEIPERSGFCPATLAGGEEAVVALAAVTACAALAASTTGCTQGSIVWEATAGWDRLPVPPVACADDEARTGCVVAGALIVCWISTAPPAVATAATRSVATWFAPRTSPPADAAVPPPPATAAPPPALAPPTVAPPENPSTCANTPSGPTGTSAAS